MTAYLWKFLVVSLDDLRRNKYHSYLLYNVLVFRFIPFIVLFKPFIRDHVAFARERLSGIRTLYAREDQFCETRGNACLYELYPNEKK